ncbi:MAG: BON domain-containing protein [Planctomycetaceae bacterium]|nr:BON domain-containing protein [Planctomycetaceae bacterium]
MATSSPALSNGHLRIDTEHHLLDMMKTAVSRLNARNVDIQFDDDAVLLSGTVDCWHDKQRIQESVRGLTGSRFIENNLQVTGGYGHAW